MLTGCLFSRVGCTLIFSTLTLFYHDFQNRAIMKICFKKPNEAVSGDFKKFGILKFHDLIKLQNCIFICQLEKDEQLAETFPALEHCDDNHNY